MFTTIGAVIFGIALMVFLISSIPGVGVFLEAVPALAWIVQNRLILYVLGLGMIGYGFSRNLLVTVLIPLVFVLVHMLGVLPI